MGGSPFCLMLQSGRRRVHNWTRGHAIKSIVIRPADRATTILLAIAQIAATIVCAEPVARAQMATGLARQAGVQASAPGLVPGPVPERAAEPLLVAQAVAAPTRGAQPTATPGRQFEFVSVKIHPMAPGSYMIKNYPHGPPFVIPTSNMFADAVHVQDLVMEAYGLSEYQILYLPAWTLAREGLVYDIGAKSPGDSVPTPVEMQQMLQSLLADKFHLKAHWETKAKFSIYALVADKNGPKFHEFHGEPKPSGDGQPAFAGTTLFALARFLTPNLDSPVIDGTGLPAGYYAFDIDKLVNFHEVDRDQQGADPAEAQDYLRTAVQHQLGLKLDPRKVSLQILIVDHIEQPARDSGLPR
jgi:uncharacterized protein (TIGR03435 family)